MTNAPAPHPRLIYKVLRPAEWAALNDQGETQGSPDDLRDGYIHFSTVETLPGTLAKWYQGAGTLILAELDTEAMPGDLRWEPARGGALFPHLYDPLRRADIGRHWTLEPAANGAYSLPPL